MRKFWNNLQPNSKWALGIFGLMVVWFASSFVWGGKDAPPEEVDDSGVPTVAVRKVASHSFTPTLQLTAQTEAADKATVAAQTEGRVKRVPVVRGDRVKAGDVLVQLDPATRQSNVRSAEANLLKNQKLVEAGRELAKDGYLAQTTLAGREADYLAAREQLALAKQDLGYANITSPIDGVVEDTPVVAGDFVQVGGPVATVVRRDEVLVVAHVGQEQRAAVAVGSEVTVKLVSGEEAPATVRFVATDADPTTRTYRVEAVVTASDAPLPTGMTATMNVPLAAVAAVEVSHSALILNDAGRVALMTVTQGTSGTVATRREVGLLADTPSGVILSGMPSGTSWVIVRGQNGVADGGAVKAGFDGAGTEQGEGKPHGDDA